MTIDLSTLSFTNPTANGESVDRWAPIPSSTWESGCVDGRRYAREAVAYMQATGDLNLVPAIVRRIAGSNEVGAVEVGFFTALAELATAGVGRGNAGVAL